MNPWAFNRQNSVRVAFEYVCGIPPALLTVIGINWILEVDSNDLETLLQRPVTPSKEALNKLILSLSE